MNTEGEKVSHSFLRLEFLAGSAINLPFLTISLGKTEIGY